MKYRYAREETCLNGGTCSVDNNILVCECLQGFTGGDCDTVVSDIRCQGDSDCGSGYFCEIECYSDDYPSHVALLSDAVTLQGGSFVSVEEARHPDLSTEFSMFAVFNQEDNNGGYLVFYGTSGNKRNFGIFLDSLNSRLFLYYLDNEGAMQSFVISNVTIDGGANQYLSLTYKSNIVNIFLNGILLGLRDIGNSNPDFTYGVSS